MIKLKPIHSLKDLEKNDLIMIKNHKISDLARVGCIDGNDLFLDPCHENFRWRKDEPFKTTLESLQSRYQILKVYND